MLGLDIGSSAIKVVELSRHQQGCRLEACAIEPVARGAVVDKTIHDVAAVAGAIQRAVSASGSRLRQAVAAVGGGTAITKMISLPVGLSELELEEQIALEANHYISYPLDEVNLDFEVLGPVPSGDRMDILLAASRSDMVENHALAVEMAGLDLKVLDIEAYALENAFPLYASQLPEGGLNKTIAVVDIGHSVSTVNVLRGGQGLYEQSQGFGCSQLDQVLQQAGLEADEAQGRLRRGMLPEEYLDSAVLPFRDSVVRHIHRTVQLYQSLPQAVALDHILISGGGALLPGLAEAVSRQCGISAAVVEPLRTLALASRLSRSGLQRQAPNLLIALGLAMRGFEA